MSGSSSLTEGLMKHSVHRMSIDAKKRFIKYALSYMDAKTKFQFYNGLGLTAPNTCMLCEKKSNVLLRRDGYKYCLECSVKCYCKGDNHWPNIDEKSYIGCSRCNDKNRIFCDLCHLSLQYITNEHPVHCLRCNYPDSDIFCIETNSFCSDHRAELDKEYREINTADEGKNSICHICFLKTKYKYVYVKLCDFKKHIYNGGKNENNKE